MNRSFFVRACRVVVAPVAGLSELSRRLTGRAFGVASALSITGVLMACSGGASDGTSTPTGSDGLPTTPTSAAASAATVEQYCAADCKQRGACRPPSGYNVQECEGNCRARYLTRGPRTRDSFLQGVTACLATISCESRESCARRYALADSAFPNVPVVQKCRRLAGEVTFKSADPKGTGTCAGSGDSQYSGRAGETCDELATLTDAARRDVDAACLDGSKRTCDELKDCVSAALK